MEISLLLIEAGAENKVMLFRDGVRNSLYCGTWGFSRV